MKRLLILTKAMFLMQLRNRITLFWNLLFPILVLIIYRLVFADSIVDDYDYMTWVLPGVLVFNILSYGLIGSSASMINMREKGILRRLLASPLPTIQLMTSYLPLRQIINCSVEALEGLENVDIVCFDDVPMIHQKADWQRHIFDLINRMRAAGKFLVFSSSLPPNEMDISLEDLRSRLNWGPVIKIKPLNDEQKRNALQLRASIRGFELPDSVANYILNNYARDLPGLLEKLEQLDQVSLEQQCIV